MKKFEILRYLKRFRALIVLVALIGSAAIYWYANGKQQYTASVVIQYTNSGISEGFTPKGTKLDVDEIYSSSVISQAMEDLGNTGSLNVIRSRCSVEEIIPEDQKTINESLLDKGEAVTYFPDTYKVNLVVGGQYGAQYARNVLDAIMQSYCTYYTEKYVEQKLSLNPSAKLMDGGYDYYECIRMLEDDTNDMLEFLRSKKEDFPNFRSSKTGYSFADLYEIYSQFKSFVIPELYARVLNGPQVKDGEVLRNYIANEISNSTQRESVQTAQRNDLKTLMQQYVEKNNGIIGRYITAEGEIVSDSYILKDIEKGTGSGAKAETTYDGLILELISIDKTVAADKIDRAFLKEISGKFGKVGSGSSGTEAAHQQLAQSIDAYEKQLESYYDIVSIASKELNLSISADYLKMISSVRVYASVNVNMYLALAAVLFFLIGCGSAILIGRLSDFVDYLLYTDKKSGLPNRDKLNQYIEGLAGRVVPDDFTCFAVRLDNLREVTKRFGYTVGDNVLRDFSGIVRQMGDTDGMVGYNGVGNFVAFFEQCSNRKAAAIVKVLDQQVAEYNEQNPEYPIEYTAAWETSSEDNVYQVRELLRLSQAKLKGAAVEEEKPDADAAKDAPETETSAAPEATAPSTDDTTEPSVGDEEKTDD